MKILRTVTSIFIGLITYILISVRRSTKSQHLSHEINMYVNDKLYIISPIEPSNLSGGGKAVKDLFEVFSRYLRVKFVSSNDLTEGISLLKLKVSVLLMSGMPILVSSAPLLFAHLRVKRMAQPDVAVFIEFAEGALFLALGKRLSNYTILRDHEILSRRIGTMPLTSRNMLDAVRKSVTIAVCKSLLRNIYEKVDVIVTLTPEDAEYIKEHFHGVANKVMTVPVVFELPFKENCKLIQPTQEFPEHSQSRHLLFLGNLYHRPNLDALQWFLKECAPYLVPGFFLHLCGMDKPLDSLVLPTDYVKVVRHGFIKDIESELGWIRIGVSPVISGGGIRIKNLYLGATGRAVVTTPLGNEGIEFEDGEAAIIRSTGKAMAEAINELADKPEFVRKLGLHASRKVMDGFGPDGIWKQYSEKIFQL